MFRYTHFDNGTLLPGSANNERETVLSSFPLIPGGFLIGYPGFVGRSPYALPDTISVPSIPVVSSMLASNVKIGDSVRVRVPGSSRYVWAIVQSVREVRDGVILAFRDTYTCNFDRFYFGDELIG